MDILPHVHGEPVLPNWFRELTKVFTRRTFTAHMSTSSVILISETQTGENTFT